MRSTNLESSRRRFGDLRMWMLTTTVSGLCLAASISQAAPPPPYQDLPVVHGCGKAQAMARGFAAQGHPDMDPRAREAMTATDVQHYELDIEVSDLDTDNNTCTITGSNRMTIHSNVADLTEFTFRLRSQYTITEALVNDTTPVTVVTDSTTTRVATLDQTYGVGAEFTLTIEYTGNSVSTGFGSIEVREQSGTPVIATLSEAYYAYTWWPVKDGDFGVPGDNSDKATLDFFITVPNNFVVPSNGLLQSVDVLTRDRKRYHWKTVYPIATYLVSFAATNYTKWTADYEYDRGIMPVEFYIYPSNDTPEHRNDWEKVIDMLGVFAPLFGEYPFINEKYGLYNFPFGGGMEHQTITGQSGYSEGLSSHELAHQWWGDMITCKTWSDIWLNEGFATYGECLWEEFKTGTPDFAAYRDCMWNHFPSGAGAGDSVYVTASAIANQGMGRIFSYTYSYLKGAWVLHQLRHVVGDETFFDILADYRAAYAFSAATTDEFAAVASATHGADLTWFFDQWVYQRGAPSYEYGWDTVNVGGQDFLHVQVHQVQPVSFPSVFIAPIDLVVTIDGAPQTFTVWNDEREQLFVVPVGGPATELEFDPDHWILRTADTDVGYTVGDLDGDMDVDGDDHLQFLSCFTDEGGSLVAGCEPVDFDGDNDVDCVDRTQFNLAWTDPGEPPVFMPCFEVGAPRAAPFPHDSAKNRYISFDPNKTVNDRVGIAFKVTLKSLSLGSCSGNGAPCRLDVGATDCGACSTTGDPCLSAIVDCVPPAPAQTCEPTGQTCVNDQAESVGTTWWVGPESPLGNDVHLLVSEAFCQVSEDWPAAVHVGDCRIVPRAAYGVRAVVTATAEESDEVVVNTVGKPGTNYWADAVGSLTFFCDGDRRNETCEVENNLCPMGQPCVAAWPPADGVTNFDDISATVFRFQQIPGLTLPELMPVDMHGNDGDDANVNPPNYVANFADIAFITLAFQGRPYPFNDPGECPMIETWP